MGYYLKAFIGNKKTLKIISDTFVESKIINLNADIFMLPMTDRLFDEINSYRSSENILQFVFLNKNIEKEILKIIKTDRLAYVESEFFGGIGGHIGVVWDNGIRVYEGEYGKETMNNILKKIGVKKVGSKDEFLTLGLDNYNYYPD